MLLAFETLFVYGTAQPPRWPFGSVLPACVPWRTSGSQCYTHIAFSRSSISLSDECSEIPELRSRMIRINGRLMLISHTFKLVSLCGICFMIVLRRIWKNYVSRILLHNSIPIAVNGNMWVRF